MHLTLYTDYSLRLLLYLALHSDGATISDVAEAYGISRNHLVRIANELGKQGVVQTTRGRSGGLRLLADPKDVNVGEIVRVVEPFHLVECFDKGRNTCRITSSCTLKHALFEAQQAFLKVVDEYTLADLVENREELLRELGHAPAK